LVTLQHLARLGSYGVRFRSFKEPYLDSWGLWGDAIIAILGTIAKQERIWISERVRAGLERARVTGTRTGRQIGRPVVVFDRVWPGNWIWLNPCRLFTVRGLLR
jgi:DNA invertase Pin-like site-specific DNA recombinase